MTILLGGAGIGGGGGGGTAAISVPSPNNDNNITTLKIRLLETQNNVDVNNPPSNFTVDGKSVNDGDTMGLFAQDDYKENGFWIMGNDHLERSDLLPEGTEVYGKIFMVTDGCTYGGTLQLFINGPDEDVVGTDNIQIKTVGESNYNTTCEVFDVDDDIEKNQYIDLLNVPDYEHFYLLVHLNGMLLTRGKDNTENDYYIDQKRVYFNQHIEQGDRVTVYYYFKNESC